MTSKQKLALLLIGVICLTAVASFLLMPKEPLQRLFTFYLPWDDSEETVVNISEWFDKPAGSLGHVYVNTDGHLYVDTKRIKFLGVNICGGAAFPEKEEAEKIAARLAKFGVNIVRFHHMDASWEPFNIFDQSFGNTRHLNLEALDRLDYFIAKLKENGIYVDLNLLVSRRFSSADGLPSEIDTVEWKDQQVLGFFVDEVTDLQKEYAMHILTHRNPYSNLTYAEDPTVAFVEIVNEQGLIQGWLGGVIDNLPETFQDIIKARWNGYLTAKYGTTNNLAVAWTFGQGIPQEEMLTNGCFEAGLNEWSVETHGQAEASNKIIEVSDGKNVLEITVSKSGEGWHVQFSHPGLTVEEGKSYLVRFEARADRSTSISVSLTQSHDPWASLSNTPTVDLTTEWKEYEVSFIASDSDENVRLLISNLGSTEATYQFSCFSMKPFSGYGLKDDENLENLSVHVFSLGEFGSRIQVAREDWVEFLMTLEGYFTEMQSYLKKELGVKSLVIGTIVGCSTPNMMAQLDVIDTHNYWQHPAFPGTAWDSSNWYVVNEPLVNHLDEGTLTSLALKRVYGKPLLVTEYNHPTPNMYDAETVITFAAYAALQDWDGVFLFDYGSRGNWDSRMIRGYFDADQDPVKMATLIPAYMMFVRGDVEAANEVITALLSRQSEINFIAAGKAMAWNLIDGSYLNIPSAAALIHRTALVVDSSPIPSQALTPQQVDTTGPVYSSDTGEVVWDDSNQYSGLLSVNTPKSIAVVGFGGGKSHVFGSITLEPKETLLGSWSVITLTVMDGQNFDDWNTLLLVTTGYEINSGAEIREYVSGTILAEGSTSLTSIKRFNNEITCANSWGEAPTLIEGIPVTISIQTSKNIEVWALNNKGEREQQVPVLTQGNIKSFVISPEYTTLWYEIKAQP